MNSADHGAAMRPAEGTGPMSGLPAAAPYPASVAASLAGVLQDLGPAVGRLGRDALALQARVAVHAQIDAAAADLRAWVKRECSVLRRATSQHFRWASVLRSAPAPRE